MTNKDPSSRHLTREGLEHYLDSGAPAVVSIQGAPPAYLLIDPLERRIALRVPASGSECPDLSDYQHISTETIYWNDVSWHEVRVDSPILLDAYPLLCAIADRLQLQKMSLTRAVLDALAAFRSILAGLHKMSDERALGLFGELLVLRHIMSKLTLADALASWRGPLGEEHDFDLGESDLEVKSTLSEHRRHRINSISQLNPTVDRTLTLLSLQMTSSGSSGTSLSELVTTIRSELSDSNLMHDFDSKMDRLNWNEQSHTLYTKKLRLRTQPAIFVVDSRFPKLSPSILAMGEFDSQRIIDVQYTIDLTNLPSAAQLPSPLDGFTNGVLNE